jgi:probable O-glycosylation ligase (exosortase A-associated)
MILLAVFIPSIPLSFVRPFYGLIWWYILAFGNPQSELYYWSATTMIAWGLLVAIPTVIGMFLFERNDFRVYRSPEVLMIVVLWIWFSITSSVSTSTPMFQHHADDTWTHWGNVSKVFLMTLVTMTLVNSWYRLKVLVSVISAIFGFFVLKAIPFLIITRGQFRILGPPQSMIGDNNDFGLALDMTLPVFFFMAQLTTSRRWKSVYYCLFACTIPAVFFTYSRGALVGFVVVMGLMLWRAKGRLLLVPAVLLGVVVAFLFAPQAWRDRMDPQQKADASVDSRLNAWAFSRNLANDFPITGGGFATFTPELYARYAPEHWEIVGPHSIYFEVLAEHGYPGLALYLTFMAVCLLGAQRLMRSAKWHGDGEAALYINMFRFSLLAFLVSGSFLQRAYFDYTFCIIACMVALRRVASERWEQGGFAEVETAAAVTA